MTHIRTSPGYPQSNGKIERWHQSLKRECIRPSTPLSVDDACRIVAGYVDHYKNVRLHSAIGYVAPRDKLEGRDKEIFAERDRNLEHARAQRKVRRHADKRKDPVTIPGQCDKPIPPSETEPGSAGKQPVNGQLGQGSSSRWVGRWESSPTPVLTSIHRTIDPAMHKKIPARRAEPLSHRLSNKMRRLSNSR